MGQKGRSGWSGITKEHQQVTRIIIINKSHELLKGTLWRYTQVSRSLVNVLICTIISRTKSSLGRCQVSYFADTMNASLNFSSQAGRKEHQIIMFVIHYTPKMHSKWTAWIGCALLFTPKERTGKKEELDPATFFTQSCPKTLLCPHSASTILSISLFW